MKQSCLPVSERDPDLLFAEQNKGRKLAKEVYKPGMIVRAILHEPFLTAATDIKDKSRSESIYGTVFTKYRKMVVVALYQNHYIALPIYTHHGKGLQGKAEPDEYVSIKDHRSPGSFTTLTKHRALVTENLNSGIDPYHPKATTHLTYPVSRKYEAPVTLEGNLDKPSIAYLLTLFYDFMPKPPAPPKV